MLKILRLEFLFSRRQLVITLSIFSAYFAYMATQIRSPRVFIVLTSVMIGVAMPFLVLAREDKFKTASLICSLPVRRSTVVLGKYTATWGATVLGLGCALLLMAVFPFSKIPVGEVLTVKSLLITLFLISLIFAVILPFTIRFGLVGVIVLLVGSQVLGILALLIAHMLRGAKDPLRVFFLPFQKGLKALFYHETTPGYLLTLLTLIIAFSAASLFISRVLYARREL